MASTTDKLPALAPGDVFASKNPQGLGRAICLAQQMQSPDGEAEYSHTGIILDAQGTTLEALWRVRRQNLFSAYKGNKVLVARWKGMTDKAFRAGFASVADQEGRMYPFHRLALHVVGLAGFVHFLGVKVCSEITDCFQYHAGITTLRREKYYGVTPDELVDEWRISRHFDIVFEGTL
ncbi:MAG: hypothetical protein PHW08_07170 [Kiritimatiellae bacterium]|nr:hypothetical protein [Kiritimatiellia bacterium]